MRPATRAAIRAAHYAAYERHCQTTGKQPLPVAKFTALVDEFAVSLATGGRPQRRGQIRQQLGLGKQGKVKK